MSDAFSPEKFDDKTLELIYNKLQEPSSKPQKRGHGVNWGTVLLLAGGVLLVADAALASAYAMYATASRLFWTGITFYDLINNVRNKRLGFAAVDALLVSGEVYSFYRLLGIVKEGKRVGQSVERVKEQLPVGKGLLEPYHKFNVDVTAMKVAAHNSITDYLLKAENRRILAYELQKRVLVKAMELKSKGVSEAVARQEYRAYVSHLVERLGRVLWGASFGKREKEVLERLIKPGPLGVGIGEEDFVSIVVGKGNVAKRLLERLKALSLPNTWAVMSVGSAVVLSTTIDVSQFTDVPREHFDKTLLAKNLAGVAGSYLLLRRFGLHNTPLQFVLSSLVCDVNRQHPNDVKVSLVVLGTGVMAFAPSLKRVVYMRDFLDNGAVMLEFESEQAFQSFYNSVRSSLKGKDVSNVFDQAVFGLGAGVAVYQRLLKDKADSKAKNVVVAQSKDTTNQANLDEYIDEIVEAVKGLSNKTNKQPPNLNGVEKNVLIIATAYYNSSNYNTFKALVRKYENKSVEDLKKELRAVLKNTSKHNQRHGVVRQRLKH